MGLEEMSFARNRLMEHYFWCNGFIWEPQYGTCREMVTKIICLITLIDDIYDVYGSYEELQLLTDFVDRWDVNEIDKLPRNIRTSFLALYNTCNEIGYWIMKERGFNIIPSLSKQWADLCKAYFKEATWYHNGYKPTMDEYLENAVVSMGVPLLLFSCYFSSADEITKEVLEFIDKLPSIVYCSSLLVRLTNDLGTSKYELARGDNLKSVEIYMNEEGVSEEIAGEHVKALIFRTWKKLNKSMLETYPFSEPFLTANPNCGRTAHCVYQYGDGHGVPDQSTRDHLISLLVEPIPIE